MQVHIYTHSMILQQERSNRLAKNTGKMEARKGPMTACYYIPCVILLAANNVAGG